MSSKDIVLNLNGISKNYVSEAGNFTVLDGVSIAFRRGEMISIMGPSGSGKSTLLGIMGTLDTPSSGSITIEGTLINDLNENQLADYRAHKIGFVFQSFNLISTMSAIENVMLPLFCLKQLGRAEIKRRAEDMLKRVGLETRMSHLPSQLSGGQQQRVAVARALINRPSLVIADEPTGNLDSASGQSILELLIQLKQEMNMTFIIATHDPHVADSSDSILYLKDGRVVASL